VHGIEHLIDWAKGFSNPWSFAYHVGKDLLVNGVQIFHEVEDAVDQYEAGNFKGFGQDIGKALAQVFVGEATSGYTLATADVEAILLGIVEGALTQSLPDFSTCEKDIETAAANIETAVKDFEKETFDGVKAGIEMIGTVVTGLSKDLSDCKAVVADVSKLEQMPARPQLPTLRTLIRWLRLSRAHCPSLTTLVTTSSSTEPTSTTRSLLV